MARLFIDQPLASPRSANHGNLITEQVRKVQIILKHGHIEPNSLMQHTPFFFRNKIEIVSVQLSFNVVHGWPFVHATSKRAKNTPQNWCSSILIVGWNISITNGQEKGPCISLLSWSWINPFQPMYYLCYKVPANSCCQAAMLVFHYSDKGSQTQL